MTRTGGIRWGNDVLRLHTLQDDGSRLRTSLRAEAHHHYNGAAEATTLCQGMRWRMQLSLARMSLRSSSCL